MDNKKRRSSLRKVEDTSEAIPRLKRRISFSGKKAIREFSKEDEAKTWNHSYEVSDHANSEASLFVNKSVKCTTSIISPNTLVDDKNETKCTIKITKSSNSLKVENINRAVVSHLQPLQAKEGVLNAHNENSSDVTLFEQEKRHHLQQSTLSFCSTYPELSFSLIDHEKEALAKARKSAAAFERTCDFIHDLSAVGDKIRKQPFASNVWQQKYLPHTIHLDEDIEACPEDFLAKSVNKPTDIGKKKHKLSMCNAVDMDLSMRAEVNKENIEPAQLKHIPDIKASQAESMLKREIEDKLVSDFQRKLANISFHMDSDDESDQNKAYPPTSASPRKLSNKTVLLNEDIHSDTQTGEERLSFDKENVAIDNSMDLTLVGDTEALKVKNEASQAYSDNKKLKPKVIMLKTFPIKEIAANVAALEQSFGLADMESSDLKCTENAAMQQPQNRNDLCETTFQSSMCYSPESSSPLFPPELVSYSGKKLNFRQLNDDIERGIIQVFRDAQCTPLATLKAKRLQFPTNIDVDNIKKRNVRGTIYFDEDINAPNENDLLSTKQDANEDDFKKMRKKHMFRFSQAGEQLLNNTNFLTHARLGDETASCNTSKSSNFSRRETVYYDMEIPCEEDDHLKDQRCLNKLEESYKLQVKGLKNTIAVPNSESSMQMLHTIANKLEQGLSTQEKVLTNSSSAQDAALKSQSEMRAKEDENMLRHAGDSRDKIVPESARPSLCVQNCNDVSDASMFSYILDDKLEVHMVDKSKTGGKNKISTSHIDKNTTDANEIAENITKSPYVLRPTKRSHIPRPTALFNKTIEIEDVHESVNVNPTAHKDDMNIEQLHAPLPNTSLPINSQNSPQINTDNFKQSVLLHSEPFTPRRLFKGRLVDGTPHRSLIEFEDLERVCNQTLAPDSKLFTPLRLSRRVTNIMPHKMDCEQQDTCSNIENKASKSNALRRFTNIVPCNIELEQTMTDDRCLVADSTQMQKEDDGSFEGKSIAVVQNTGLHNEKAINSNKFKELRRYTNVEPSKMELEQTIADERCHAADSTQMLKAHGCSFESKSKSAVAPAEDLPIEQANKSNTFKALRRYTNIEPCHIELEQTMTDDRQNAVDSSQMLKKHESSFECKSNAVAPSEDFPKEQANKSSTFKALRRFTNIVPCNIDLEPTMLDDSFHVADASKGLKEHEVSMANKSNAVTTNVERCTLPNEDLVKANTNKTIIDNVTIIEDDEDGAHNIVQTESNIQANVMKRLPFNLTPLITTSKKRQMTEGQFVMDTQPDMRRKTELFAEEMHIDSFECSHSGEMPKEANTAAEDCKLEKSVAEDANVEELQQALSTKMNVTDHAKEECNNESVPMCVEKVAAVASNTTTTGKLNNSLKNLSNIDCDLETIQMPRRAISSNQRKSNCLNVLPVMDAIGNIDFSMLDQFKDSVLEKDAITISDVSVFYQHQSKHFSTHNEKQTANNNEVTPNETGRASDTELQNVALFKKKYINCTSDSLFLTLGGVDCDEIDKTRISLVETLSDDDESDDCNGDHINCNGKCLEINEDPQQIGSDKTLVNATQNQTGKRKSDVCRKCKRCQETFLNETSCSEIEPFALPTLPKYPNLGLDRLRRLRQLPSLKEAHDYWRRLSAEHTFNTDHMTIADATINLADDSLNNLNPDKYSADSIIANYKFELKKAEKSISISAEAQNQPRATFVLRLTRLLKSCKLHNWIFDYSLQIKNIYIFTHKKVVTTNFILPFEPLDALGEHVVVRHITMTPTRFNKKNWSALHCMIDFQLKLDFSLILLTLGQINNETGVVELLEKVGKLCEDAHNLAFRLFRLVCQGQATLIRDGNKIYVHKMVTTSGSDFTRFPSLEKHEFLIEIKNMNKICYRDIRKPQLYAFKEEIELLPCGPDFIRLFFCNPLKYLK